MNAKRMKLPRARMDSSFITYSSWEMTVARRPVPRIAVPVLVMRFGEDGSLLMISEARSEGGGGLEVLAIERLGME
jgi:hypothetical protein